MSHLDIAPIERVRGHRAAAGSKSISNRPCCSRRSPTGTTRVRDVSSPTTRRICAALRRSVSRSSMKGAGSLLIGGTGGRFRPRGRAFLGNAGTAFANEQRCSRDGRRLRLSGCAHARAPIGDLVDALRRLGARIEFPARKATRRCESARVDRASAGR